MVDVMDTPLEQLSARSILARVLVVGLCALLGAELVTRAFLTSPSRQAFDAEMGWVWQPDTEVFNGKEGGARVQMNALGLNDAALGATGGARRAAVLGNSFTEALQVDQGANFTGAAEQLAPRWQLVNLGRSAMGPTHYPAWLDRFAPRLEPELVIVTLGGGDLEHVMGPQTEVTRDSAGVIASVRLLPETKDSMKRAFEPLLTRSALATYLMRRYKPAMMDWVHAARRLLGHESGAATAGAEAVPAEPAAEENEADREEATARLAFMLRDMARHAPVVVLDIPELIYHSGRRSALAAPDASAVYREAARRAGARFVDAGPALQQAYSATGVPGHGFHDVRIGTGHLNEVGHQAVGKALASELSTLAEAGPRERAQGRVTK